MYAVRTGYWNLCRCLCEARADVGEALSLATQYQLADCVRELLPFTSGGELSLVHDETVLKTPEKVQKKLITNATAVEDSAVATGGSRTETENPATQKEPSPKNHDDGFSDALDAGELDNEGEKRDRGANASGGRHSRSGGA